MDENEFLKRFQAQLEAQSRSVAEAMERITGLVNAVSGAIQAAKAENLVLTGVLAQIVGTIAADRENPEAFVAACVRSAQAGADLYRRRLTAHPDAIEAAQERVELLEELAQTVAEEIAKRRLRP